MSRINNPDAERLYSTLPTCPYGCDWTQVYNTSTFNPHQPISDQTAEHIAICRAEAPRMLQDHLGYEHLGVAKRGSAPAIAEQDELAVLRRQVDGVRRWAESVGHGTLAAFELLTILDETSKEQP